VIVDVPFRDKQPLPAILATPGLGADGVLAIDHRLRDPDLEALLAAPALRDLDTLILWALRGKRAGAILAACPLRKLTRLELSCGTVDVRALVASPVVARVERLGLCAMRLDVGALARSTKLGKLVELDVGENGITSAGLIALAKAPFARRLRRLRLWTNKLDPRGMPALAKLVRLERLDLSCCALHDAAISPLAKALPRTLTHLLLDTNATTTKGLRALLAAELPRLEVISSQDIDAALAAELRAAFPSLREVRSETDPTSPFGADSPW
jgi:hypothetical protein